MFCENVRPFKGNQRLDKIFMTLRRPATMKSEWRCPVHCEVWLTLSCPLWSSRCPVHCEVWLTLSCPLWSLTHVVLSTVKSDSPLSCLPQSLTLSCATTREQTVGSTEAKFFFSHTNYYVNFLVQELWVWPRYRDCTFRGSEKIRQPVHPFSRRRKGKQFLETYGVLF